MKLVRELPAVALAFVAATGLAACGSVSVTSPPTSGSNLPEGAPPEIERLTDGTGQVEVVRVIDGDTVDVVQAGRAQRVRLVGIDAPEQTTLRTGRAECGGADATRALKAIRDAGSSVTLRLDPSQDAVDRYGRVLAYVTTVGHSTTWQERMLAGGWARVFSLRRNPIELLDDFTAAADRARADRAGVWARCGGDFRRPE